MNPATKAAPAGRAGPGTTPAPPLPLARGGRLEPGRCRVMGILNATPDSFSDGGLLDPQDPGALEARVRSLLDAGADLLDVGGESTRPGHAPVPADEELERVLPVLAAVRRVDAHVPVSIDTRKPQVARAALEAGADLVNDVSGLSDAAMIGVVREAGCAVVAMRHEGLSGDPVAACRGQLQGIRDRGLAGGLQPQQVVLDPGLGFGDGPGADPGANLALVDRLAEAVPSGHAVLVGASRKRFVGTLTGINDPAARVHGSVAVAVLAALRGAAIVRVHDVAETAQALRALAPVTRRIPGRPG